MYLLRAFVLALALAAAVVATATTPPPAPPPVSLANLVYHSPFRGRDAARIPYAALLRRRQQPAPPAAVPLAFLHGVASGDPRADRVVLWTKVTPSTNVTAPVLVNYTVSAAADLSSPLAAGATATSGDVDYTVKLDVPNLSPATAYYYRFASPDGSNATGVGQTRTLPAAGDVPAKFTIATISCMAFWHGYFSSLGNIARNEEVDAVVHLGDVIYEYSKRDYPSVDGSLPDDRDPQPNVEIVSLSDYRTRHAQTRTDPDYQEMTRVKPMIMIYDDHEFADNAWMNGAANHDPETQGPWSVRKANAARAWWEYTPTRPVTPDVSAADPSLYSIYRVFRVGALFDLIMLDTRIEGRDQQAAGDPQTRRLISEKQGGWLFNTLNSSTAKWRVLGNQVIMAPIPNTVFGSEVPILNDAWVGYPAARQRVLEFVANNNISNTCCVTGDLHASVASDLFLDAKQYDPATGKGAVMPEFVGPSVTSASPVRDSESLGRLARDPFVEPNPGAKFVNLWRHGYMLVTVAQDKVRTEYRFVESVKRQNGGREDSGAVLEVVSGSNRITRQS
ncbi:hypothetical protein H9P43_009305 [Blastocladiella emersonii ATCC 22665]|nr:hypothetical protein H9P43_009305 [Blastocladiella emersonii ATCC 22665]